MKRISAAFLVICVVSSTNAFGAPSRIKPAKPNLNSVQYRQPSKVTQNFVGCCQKIQFGCYEIVFAAGGGD